MSFSVNRRCIASRAAASGLSSSSRALVKFSRCCKTSTPVSPEDVQLGYEGRLEGCREASIASQSVITSMYLRCALLPAAVVACLAAIHLVPPPRPARAAVTGTSSLTTALTSAQIVSNSGGHGQRTTSPNESRRAEPGELIRGRSSAGRGTASAPSSSGEAATPCCSAQPLAELAAAGNAHGGGSLGTEESARDQQLASDAYAKAVAAAAAGGGSAQPLPPLSQQSIAIGSGGVGGGSSVDSPSILQMIQQQQESLSSRVFRATRPSVVNISHSRSAQSFSTLNVTSLPQGQASGFIW